MNLGQYLSERIVPAPVPVPDYIPQNSPPPPSATIPVEPITTPDPAEVVTA
jgi:hypothetical protein